MNDVGNGHDLSLSAAAINLVRHSTLRNKKGQRCNSAGSTSELTTFWKGHDQV
jgi:hypothetical protein